MVVRGGGGGWRDKSMQFVLAASPNLLLALTLDLPKAVVHT